MIKIFDDGNKTNFVDDNNVMLGYDSFQDCCEYAAWFIAPHCEAVIEPCGEDKVVPELSGYEFDPEFFKDLTDEHPQEGFCGGRSDIDEGGHVAFKLVSSTEPDLYLHIFNAHNGYYGHGFEFKAGDNQLQSGGL